ncbi:glycosyltransferase [Leifsonia shinshuensis]|uniref:glycosyltransferase n=1 Tax=Leifsonia shinshuensis TaxID=150026 RepID=UPI001F50721F|nr:glycosyltransferase [Leifsonia shinshuensis]MCI0159340.1 glycosyltransferase [Leifsonia shinshuensis]
MSGRERIVVQQSFPAPRPTTNPYIVMLLDSLRSTPGLEVRTFGWRSALLGRYDVFHAHWPEILVSGHSPLKSLVRQGLTALLLLRLAITRTPIVRTMHNLQLPQGISRRERALLRWFDRRTALRIGLNPTTPFPPGSAHATILHGDYRKWFAPYPHPEREPGRVGYFGLIRRYKGVEELLEVFADLPGDGLRLTVAGRPSSDELAESVRDLAARDSRITARLVFLEDADIADLVGRSQLIVLPYRDMHNSGGVLAALSLDRPVLVPDNATTEALAREVGEQWVLRYDALTPQVLGAAITRAATIPADARPDLSARSWSATGTLHRDAYAQAVARRARKRP